MRRSIAFGSITAAALALAATSLSCGSGDAPEAGRPATPPPAATAAPEPPAAPPVAPAAAAEAPAETGAVGGDAAAGGQQYAVFCASCHGPTGNGDGPVAAGLDPKPARHSDGAYMNALSDGYLFKVIKEGGAAVGKSPLMAPWGGTLSDAQIRDVIAYVRTLAEPPYPGS
jgi:mono/diheme cytochrome c family protein